ncbi:Crp/Fnr family transcriptional regulator [Micromonospora sp. DT231]|uniref:Crp/Fnr family transcriptional regulator n=1 Tax=Micromonospora sp. DT231 TaxID=3416526 RepID=UPI003CF24E2C
MSDDSPQTDWPRQTMLGRLHGQALTEICAAGTRVDIASGRLVFRQGDRSRHVLVLLNGSVKVVALTEGGYEALLAVRVGGEIAGEMAAVDGDPRSARGGRLRRGGRTTNRADRTAPDRQAAPGDRRGDTPYIQPEASLGEPTKYRSPRLRCADPSRPNPRLVGGDARHAEPSGPGVGLPLRQGELASMAGVALPTAEKTLLGLDQQGLISRGHRQLVIRDLPGLRKVSQMTDQIPY